MSNNHPAIPHFKFYLEAWVWKIKHKMDGWKITNTEFNLWTLVPISGE